MKLLLTLILVAGTLFAAVHFGSPYFESESETIPTVILSKQRVERSVPAEGYLKAEKATELRAPRGRKPYKIAWVAPNGSRVKSGEVVVKFDKDELNRSLADGQDAQKTANARLASQQLRSRTSISDRARNASLAEMDLELSRSRSDDENDDIFPRNELIKSQIDGELSIARVVHAKSTSRVDQAISGSSKKLLKIELKSAQIAIKQAQEGLERMEVTAPHDGIFVYDDSNLKAGDTIYGGQGIGQLPLVETMEAEVFVLEADAMGLAEGKPATLFLESHKEKLYKATIKKVDALAKRRQRETPTQYFSVTLELETTDTKIMKPGQRVQATIDMDSEEALLLPRQCIFNVDGDWVAYRLMDGNFEPIKVTLGFGTPGRVVIEEGLEAGDVIATRDPFGKAAATSDDKKNSETSEPTP